MDRQCSSCGGFCKKSGCEREKVQPEQTPVAWITKGGTGELWWSQSVDEEGNPNSDDVPLYTAPPQREWQGLTDEERLEILAVGGRSRSLVCNRSQAEGEEHMTTFAHALQCYTTAARLNGYADALDDSDGRYESLIHTLKKAAALLEDVWAQHQQAEQQKAEKQLRAEHPEIFK